MADTMGLCLSDACIHAASGILWSLSPSYMEMDPCTDFEALTCGGWKSRHMLDAANTRIGTFSILGDDADRLVRHILEDGYPGQSNHSDDSPLDMTNYKMLVGMYDACMNLTAIEEAASKPLVAVLGELSEVFPEDDASEDKSFVSDAILIFSKLGWNTIIGIGPGIDDMKPDTMILSVYPPSSISLPANQYYLEPEIIDAYAKGIALSLFGLITGNLSEKEALQRATAVVDFEARLAGAIPPITIMSEPEKYYNLMSWEDTTKLAPVLGLEKTVQALTPEEYDFKTKNLITSFPEYLANVSEIVQDTDVRTLKDFFLWQAVTAFADKVQTPELDAYHGFRGKMYGVEHGASHERSKICVNHVKDGLMWIVGRFHVEQAFSKKSREYGEKIISSVKKEYVRRFEEAEWMDEETRRIALKKLEKTLVQIGYPKTSPNTSDAESLRKYYEGLEIGSSFFNNSVALNRFRTAKSWADLAKPVDKHRWAMSPAEVNAYNQPVFNTVVFPAAIMQFPVFGAELPSYVSYGAFGSIAGHEISHSFDDRGRKFDEGGAYRNWWTNETMREFEKRTRCFVEQFSNFSVPDPDGHDPVPLNGELMLGEILADTGGIKVSFNAWQARRQYHPDLSLPGLDFFTHDQLFFVFFAMLYCGRHRPEALMSQVLTDPHPPGRHRILGTLQNSAAFREAFNCPVKEPTCTLW